MGVDLKNAPGSVTATAAAQPDATLACAEEDFVGMCLGTTDAMKLFMSGKLKITGNMGAAQKLEFFKKLDRSLVDNAMNTRLGRTNGAPPSAPPRVKSSQASTIFRGVATPAQKSANRPRDRRAGRGFQSSGARRHLAYRFPRRDARGFRGRQRQFVGRDPCLGRGPGRFGRRGRDGTRTCSNAAGCASMAMCNWCTPWIFSWEQLPLKAASRRERIT